MRSNICRFVRAGTNFFYNLIYLFLSVLAPCFIAPCFITYKFILTFFFLVLPVYCYQPISLHLHACMLSLVTLWTAAFQAPPTLAGGFFPLCHLGSLSFTQLFIQCSWKLRHGLKVNFAHSFAHYTSNHQMICVEVMRGEEVSLWRCLFL